MSTVVPNRRTLALATRLLSHARNSTGADAALRMGDVDPDQLPALIGVLLDASVGRVPRLVPRESGRPVINALAVKCPTCGAEPYKPCRIPSGWARRPHTTRRGKRCVRCGEPVAGSHHDYCGPECANEAKKERDRAYSLAYRKREAS